MAKKLVRLTATGRIDYNGEVYLPGTDKNTFDCDAAEAKRLIGLGVAAAGDAAPAPAARISTPSAAELALQAHVDLLAKVAAAATREELEALLPEEEPADEVQSAEILAAFTARHAELTEPE